MYNEIACGFLSITFVALDIIWLSQTCKETRYACVHSFNMHFSIYLLYARHCVTNFKLKLAATTKSALVCPYSVYKKEGLTGLLG